MIDIHSHLIYGVDDGAKTLEDSVSIIKDLKNWGYTDLIITPHYITETVYTSPRQDNRIKLAKIQNRLRDEDIDINIYLGNEIYIDRGIEDLLKNYQISPLADTKFLLIELPMSGEFDDYESILTSLVLKGYRVILAHPERYHSFQKNYKKIEYLYNNGIFLQVNLGSLTGKYGKKAEKLAKKLLKDDLVFTLATDIHHKTDTSKFIDALKKLEKCVGAIKADELLNKNPRQILESMIK